MIEFKNNNPEHCDPPGAFVDILAHPFDKINKSIEKAIFKEHRFAFFYWMKWHREIKKNRTTNIPPLLVSIDYHTDLVFSDSEKEEIKQTPEYDLADLAMFCWARMCSTNDGHILSAAYLNLIGDIVLLKRQESLGSFEDEGFNDLYGNKHRIYEFDDVDKFEEYLITRSDEKVFFDIDLDYFIVSEGNFLQPDSWIMMEEADIRKIINPERSFIKWIKERIEGFTIATEPDYCGGIKKSSMILTIIEDQLFDDNGGWKNEKVFKKE